MNLPIVFKAPDEVLEGLRPQIATVKTQLSADFQDAVMRKKAAAALKIATDAAYEAAGTGLVAVMRHLDTLEAARLKLTGPINALLNEINGAYRPNKQAWTEVRQLVESAGLKYQRDKRESAAAAAAAAQRLAMTAPVVGTGPQAVAYQALAAHAAAPPAAAAGVIETGHWAWECADPREVPFEFHMLDEKKINGVVKAMKGTTMIRGIRVFWVDHMQVRRG